LPHLSIIAARYDISARLTFADFAEVRAVSPQFAYRDAVTVSEPSSDSLVAALAQARIPAANHEFIQKLMTDVDIVEYRAVAGTDKAHVVAVRRDGRRDLHIFYGYTTGFDSQEEIVRFTGAAVGRPSSRKGTWYVEHPVNRVSPTSERSRDVRRRGGQCACGMQLSLTGVCASCD
jgi:hypothetical protein